MAYETTTQTHKPHVSTPAERTAVPAGSIVVIGDSHIGLRDGNEKPIIEWIGRLAAWKPKALYLNGDLFHYLIAHPKFYTPSVGRVFDRFRELRDGGVAVHYVEGNRDFFLRGSFAEKAVTDVGLEYGFTAGDRKYLIVHGDMINDRDLPYRFWRQVSKNPISKLGLELIPKKSAQRFVDSVEQRLAKSNFKHKSRLPVELMEAYALQRRKRNGYTDVVFGHFHEKTVLHPGASTVTVLPPWYETGEAMIIDPASGAASFAVV
jgi:UDP-2,3-diacylglucosamine hydrolase